MSGTSEGSKKAALTNKRIHGEDFFAKIGAKSWTNPDRSHKTGFALLPLEEVSKLGALGGSKTKEQYATNKKNTDETDGLQGQTKVGDTFKINGETYKVALVEQLPNPTETEEVSPSVSE